MDVKVNGSLVKHCSPDVGFKVLGTRITFDGKQDLELEIRLDKTWKAFFKFRDILTNKAVGVGKRLLLAERILRPCALWCAGSWNLRADQLDKL